MDQRLKNRMLDIAAKLEDARLSIIDAGVIATINGGVPGFGGLRGYLNAAESVVGTIKADALIRADQI